MMDSTLFFKVISTNTHPIDLKKKTDKKSLLNKNLSFFMRVSFMVSHLLLELYTHIRVFKLN